MRYRLLCVGKLKQNFLKEACAEYAKRLRPYGELTQIEVPEDDDATERKRTRSAVGRGRKCAAAADSSAGLFDRA